MMKYCKLLIAALFLLINCSTEKQSAPLIDFNTLLSTKLEGFSRSSEINVFNRKQLADRLANNSEIYLTYGIRQAAGCQFQKDNTTYSVDIFEFSNMLGAFGIYARRRMPGDKYISVGTQSLIGQGYIYYFKDRFFMTINTYGDDLPGFQSLIDLTELIDNLLPGPELMPTQIEIFPEKRLIINSFKFWPKGFDNYSVPDSCWSADYSRYNKTTRLFYSLNRSNVEYDTFVKLLQKKGRVMTHMAGVGQKSVYAISEDDGKILLGYSEGVMFGVINVTNDYWAKALCEALFQNMGLELKIKKPG